MTDVRLTALNPVDSQVYPVACNTSGELIVEQVDPGPDLTVTGNLTVDGTTTCGSATFAGNIQATESRSSTAGSNTGGLSINPSDTTIYYNFRVDEVDNDLRIDTLQGADKIKFSPNGDVTVAGSVDLTNSTIDLYSQTTNSASKTFQIFSDIGGAKTEKAVVKADGEATFAGDIYCTDSSKGFVLKSPNGTNYRLSVANDGTLSTSAV